MLHHSICFSVADSVEAVKLTITPASVASIAICPAIGSALKATTRLPNAPVSPVVAKVAPPAAPVYSRVAPVAALVALFISSTF